MRHLVHHTSGLIDRDLNDVPGCARSRGVPGAGQRRPARARSAGRRARVPAGLALPLLEPRLPPARTGRRGGRRPIAGRRFAERAALRAARHDATPSSGTRRRTLPPAAARGHFVAVDGRTYVEPAAFHAVGAGGLWTTVDDLARWDAAFYDPDGGRAAAWRRAARSTTARRSTTAGDCRCARIAACRSTVTAARSPDGRRRWCGSPTRAHDRRRACEPRAGGREQRWRSQMADRCTRRSAGSGARPRRRHLRRTRLSAAKVDGSATGCFGTLAPSMDRDATFLLSLVTFAVAAFTVGICGWMLWSAAAAATAQPSIPT